MELQTPQMIFTLTVLLLPSGALSDPNIPEMTVRLRAHGMVQVYHNGLWTEVSADQWDTEDAHVVCRQLGFPSLGAIADGIYASLTSMGCRASQILIANVTCSGSEESLKNCSYNWLEIGCHLYYESATVTCKPIRLVGGRTQSEGRVEIRINETTWAAVCSDGWGEIKMQTACRQLGFDWTRTSPQSYSESTEGRFPVLMLVGCSYKMFKLEGCYYEVQNCSASPQYAGVSCRVVWLHNGWGRENRYEGLVRVYRNHGRDRRWGAVCAHGWDTSDAGVVCRYMGLPSEGARVKIYSQNEVGRKDVLMNNVSCTGHEGAPQDCEHSEHTNCTAGYAGVACKIFRLSYGSSETEGMVEVYDKGTWGAVCSDRWDTCTAAVVCNELFPELYSDCRYAPEERIFGEFSVGRHPIVATIGCRGTEKLLSECQISMSSRCSAGNKFAGVNCKLERGS